MDVAKEVSKSLSEKVVIAKVDDELWDLERPLEKSCKLELLDFDHPEGALLNCLDETRLINVSRQEGLLAFFRTRSRRGLGAPLWLPPLLGTPDG